MSKTITEAEQIANSFLPFINPQCKEVHEILKDMAKTIQSAINRNSREFSEKELIYAIKLGRKMPHTYLSTDIVEIIRTLEIDKTQ